MGKVEVPILSESERHRICCETFVGSRYMAAGGNDHRQIFEMFLAFDVHYILPKKNADFDAW